MTFCWHRYTKWGKIIITADKSAVQAKHCVYCNKIKMRRVA